MPDDSPPDTGGAAVRPDVAKRAHRFLLAALACYLLGVAVASPWDIYWHTQMRFESFWSPPHLFLYASVLFGAATIAGIAANPELRSAFGRPLEGLPRWMQFPPSLVILGAGFVMMIVAGLFDDFWHTTWGQNETRWSLPHGLLAFGVYTIALGLTACRIALAPSRPFGRFTAMGYGLLVLAFSLPAFLGPMAFNLTPEVNARISAMPGFWGPDTQGLMKIIERWTLDRTNLLFPLMSAAWAVAGIAVVGVLDRRPGVLLATTLVAMLVYTGVGILWALHTQTLSSPSAWLPGPIAAAAAAWVGAEKMALRPPLPWALAGLSMALLTAAIYNPTAAGFGFSLLGAPAGWAAGLVGERLAGQLKAPTPRGMKALLLLLCAVGPVVMGTVDIFFRLAH